MSAPIALSTNFTDFTTQGARRAFCATNTSATECILAFETALTLGAASGPRLLQPSPPAVVDTPAPLVPPQQLTLKVPANGSARTPVMDDPSGYLRYVSITGTPTSVWADVAPQPAAGPAGPAGGGAASLGPAVALALANQATLSGLAQTIDGVALTTAGMRVYLAAQTTPTQTGLWVVQSGVWTRPLDWASGSTIPLGTQIAIAPGGTSNFQTYGCTWYVDSASGVVDTGTIIAYPVIVKGIVALTSASPSTATISNLWIKHATQSALTLCNETTAGNGMKGVLTAGAGTGSLVITGPNTVTDSISWSIANA